MIEQREKLIKVIDKLDLPDIQKKYLMSYLIETQIDMFDDLRSIRDNTSDYSDPTKLVEILFDKGWNYELCVYMIENVDFENLSENEFENSWESIIIDLI